MADLLDLDAEVLSDYHREVAEWVSANLTERARVIDVGAGTGTGTLALARQLPDAEVIALQPPPDSPMAASVTRYAKVTFCRARHGLQDKLSAGDIAELDALAPALSTRDDLTVRTSRTVWLARKPAG